MDNLDTRRLLSGTDSDRLASMIANLLEEVVVLSERVAELEGGGNLEEGRDRANAIIDRVMAPLA